MSLESIDDKILMARDYCSFGTVIIEAYRKEETIQLAVAIEDVCLLNDI